MVRLQCILNSENIRQATTVLVHNWDRVPYITERNAQALASQKLLENFENFRETVVAGVGGMARAFK